MKIRSCGNYIARYLALGVLSMLSSVASAQLLDEVTLHENKDTIDIQIKLADRIHYLRHFPEKHAQTLDIYFDISLGAAVTSQAEENEKRQSPPSNFIPHFTVTSQQEYGVHELVIEFDRDVDYTVRPSKDQRGFTITVPKMSPAEMQPTGQIGPDVPDLDKQTKDENDEKAKALMVEVKEALQSGANFKAITALNQLLELPANVYTQDAQEWAGIVRERSGQPDKARLEYESYLKLYTTGPEVERVKQRLAKLPAKAVEKAPVVAEKKGAQTETYGSLSMYFYHGASSNDTTTTDTVTNQLTQSAFSTTDQNSLNTNVDVSTRYRSDEYDNRLVFQDTFIKNNLAGQVSRNKLYKAYFQIKNKKADYSALIGRQSALGGGVVGRFDGVSAGAGFMSSFRGNIVAGRLADTSSTAPPTEPVFYGASVDIEGSPEGGWSGSLYAINQTLESVADRKAVGTELRYYETNKSVFALLDYDTLYKAVNTALLQGSMNLESGMAINFMIDHRKTPSLSTRNALNGATVTSLKDLLLATGMSETALRDLARARTATANLAEFGITQPLNDQWSVGGDIKLSNVSSMPASGTTDVEGILPFSQGTGNEWTFTGQLIGSNILALRDISVLGVSRITSDLINAQSAFASNRSVITSWTLDTSLRYYRQNNLGITTSRLTPSFKVTYALRERTNLEFEGSLERNSSSGNGTSSTTTRKFVSAGFRADF